MDAIFKALNDPARRAILDSLRARDGQTLGELEAQFAMSRFGVMKHLKVLEDAHLIVTRREGRFKHHHLNAFPLQEMVDRWVEPLLAKPAVRRLSTLKAQLEQDAMSRPDFVMSTYIRCSQESLWNALRSAEAARQFDFIGANARQDGTTITFVTPDGADLLINREIEAVPMTRLVTTFEGQWPEAPPPSRVVYLITPMGNYCRLTVEHWDVNERVAPGEGVMDGWERTLAGLKTWLETGQPACFDSQVPFVASEPV